VSDLDDVVRVAVHPAIGVARVGNSPTEFFYAPEAPGAVACDADDCRDAQGRIKRQAVRFRVYGYDAKDEVVREVTAADADITWTVHVAKTKASWFRFDQALDIVGASGTLPGTAETQSVRRNLDVSSADRFKLNIDPGAVSISGVDVNKNGGDPAFALDKGEFFGKPVSLGELRTDAGGRLVFLGGLGPSGQNRLSFPGVSDFANNDGWHDDVSDGPVDASVRFKGNGRSLAAQGAWVVVAPPDFAPGVQAIVTGYDLLFEVATRIDPGLLPKQTRFSQHIYPLLSRFVTHQWVNAGFLLDFGWGAKADFTRPDMIQSLNDRGPASEPLRSAVFAQFRPPNTTAATNPGAWPRVYGDGLDTDAKDPPAFLTVLATQYDWLGRWSRGDFDNDGPPVFVPFDKLPEPQRPAALDRAALEDTIGGPFHPGAEFTWVMRHQILYEAPFRVRRRKGPESDWPTQLTPKTALAPGGPLDGTVPGGITRWMACPWQTDTASCLSAYDPHEGDYLPTYWPARVPNDVLTDEQYRNVTDPSKPLDERLRAFGPAQRRKWLRGFSWSEPVVGPAAMILGDLNLFRKFVDNWSQIGIVARRTVTPSDPKIPDAFWVETGRSAPP
jgi:hypothetical protein